MTDADADAGAGAAGSGYGDGDGKEAQRGVLLVGTMGMFIIDTFRFYDAGSGADLGDRGLGEHIGGGGCYFAIGARVW